MAFGYKVVACCTKCNCSFTLYPETFKPCAEMKCPNCGNEIPAEEWQRVKEGMSSLETAAKFIDGKADDAFEYELASL